MHRFNFPILTKCQQKMREKLQLVTKKDEKGYHPENHHKINDNDKSNEGTALSQIINQMGMLQKAVEKLQAQQVHF